MRLEKGYWFVRIQLKHILSHELPDGKMKALIHRFLDFGVIGKGGLMFGSVISEEKQVNNLAT